MAVTFLTNEDKEEIISYIDAVNNIPSYEKSVNYVLKPKNHISSNGLFAISSYTTYTYCYEVKKNTVYNVRVADASTLRIAKYNRIPESNDTGELLIDTTESIDTNFSFDDDTVMVIYGGSTNNNQNIPIIEVTEVVTFSNLENKIIECLTGKNMVRTSWTIGGISSGNDKVAYNRLRTDFIYADYPLLVTNNKGYNVAAFQYNENKEYIKSITLLSDKVHETRVPEGYFYKFCISDHDVNITDISSILENIIIMPITLLDEDNTDILKLNDLKSIENKIKNIKSPFGSAGGGGVEPLVLLHLSDIHADGENLQRVKTFYDVFYTCIDNVIHTGDSVNRLFTDDFNFWADTGGNGFLNVIGNHDAGWSDDDPSSITKLACYNRYISPFIANWGVVQPENAETEGLCYYYKDYLDYGYRLIVLDACHYDTDQNDWFISVLESARTSDLHVIVANHFGTYDKVASQSSFCSLEMAETLSSSTYILNDNALNAIETFRNNGGTFVCHICGHTHRDEISYNNAYPKQLFIAVNTAGTIKSGHDFARKRGIKSQDLFNIVGFDHDQQKIKVFRVGADYDVNMRNVDTFCYDYRNNTMIYTS